MLKRLFDVIVSLTLLILLLPFMIILSVINRRVHGPPAIFIQERAGFRGRPFDLFKFRSMTEEKDEQGRLLPDHLRLTRFGRFLRRTSLDELPSLINVLRGDMSLVGPRPLLLEYLPLYNDYQAQRLAARPGITGWAQINGRNAISWQKKFELDIWYVKNQNFRLDLKILFLTLARVLRREDIAADNHETMPKFRGNEDEF